MLTTHKIDRLAGSLGVPGDKSISHRAVMVGSLARGRTQVKGFLPGEDCLSSIDCFRQLGITITREGAEVTIEGKGLYGLKEPENILNTGNSGTTMRLISGILAGQPFFSVLSGDDSLRRRPMDRVAIPLRQMGAHIEGRMKGKFAPLAIRGGSLKGISYELPVASAQVKSAILLAGLFAEGPTTVIEPAATRDHSERMLRAAGIAIKQSAGRVELSPAEPSPLNLTVPGDISSAAFFLAAAAALPGSELILRDVGLNPTRTGIIDVLRQMGATIEVLEQRESGGEPLGDLRVTGRRLHAVDIGGEIIPRLIDEIPIIAVAATQAEGVTRITGAAELKVKESNRIRTVVEELSKLGAQIVELEDGMEITGPCPLKGGSGDSHGDHRIAMALSIAGLFAETPVQVQDSRCIDISFPGFAAALKSIAR